MWFDTHCHSFEPDGSEPGPIAAALDAGLRGVVVLGTDVDSSRAAIATARREGVWAGAAFHPTSTAGFRPEWLDAIEELIADPRVVAVGETGLDLYWDRSYLDDQVAAFEAHIDLAKRADKALVIHTRESVDEALEVLARVGPPERLVFHCWSGDEAQLSKALELGSYISFAGNITFKKSGELRRLASLVPGERLLVETDSPYLTPEPHRGKENEPAYVTHVGECIAEVRGRPADEVASETTENALRLFGIS